MHSTIRFSKNYIINDSIINGGIMKWQLPQNVIPSVRDIKRMVTDFSTIIVVNELNYNTMKSVQVKILPKSIIWRHHKLFA